MITLPDEIHLAAMRQTWNVFYVDSPGKLTLIEEPNRELIISGKRYTKSAALHIITNWVKLKAKQHLTKVLDQLSQKTKIKYKKVTVRAYRMEWGYYSPGKLIHLNYVLVFLPPALVKYVIYHELSHSVSLKHAERFWHKLGTLDRHSKKHEKALEDAYNYVPEWIDF